MRTVDYFSIASKDLRRQKVRSVLTLLALIISTIILVVMSAISIGGRQAIANQFGSNDALTTIMVTPSQASGALSPFGDVQQVSTNATKLNDATVTQLAKIPHVQSVTPRAQIWEFDSFSVNGSSKQFVAQAEGIPSTMSLSMKAGNMFNSTGTQQVVVLGYAYAKELGYENDPQQLVGKTMQILTQKGYRGAGAAIPAAGVSQQAIDTFNNTQTTLTATIVGVTDVGPDQNAIFIPLNWAHAVRTAQYQEGGGLIKTVDQLAADGYTSLEVRADQTADVSSITNHIQELGYGEVSILSQIQRIQQLSTTMWILLGAVAVIAALASALGVVNTMLMAVSEQQYAVGVWRAVGARRSMIVRLFLTQSGLLGLIGGLVGVGFGLLSIEFVNQYVNALLQAQGFNLTNIALAPWWLIVGTVLLTTLFGVIAGMYPAYRAARQDVSHVLSSGQ